MEYIGPFLRTGLDGKKRTRTVQASDPKARRGKMGGCRTERM